MSDSANPMDCSPPGSFIHGISQARILKWVSISFSRGSSQLRDWTCVSCIGRQILYHWATREACCVRGCLCSKGRGNVKSHKRQPGKMGMNPNVKETLNYLLLWPESCAAPLLSPYSSFRRTSIQWGGPSDILLPFYYNEINLLLVNLHALTIFKHNKGSGRI